MSLLLWKVAGVFLSLYLWEHESDSWPICYPTQKGVGDLKGGGPPAKEPLTGRYSDMPCALIDRHIRKREKDAAMLMWMIMPQET